MVHKVDLTSKELAKLIFKEYVEPKIEKGKHNFIWKIEPMNGRTVFSFKQLELEKKKDESLSKVISE